MKVFFFCVQCDLGILFYFVSATVVHLYVSSEKGGTVPGFVMCLFMRIVYDEINYADETSTLPVCLRELDSHSQQLLPCVNLASESFMKGLKFKVVPLHDVTEAFHRRVTKQEVAI